MNADDAYHFPNGNAVQAEGLTKDFGSFRAVDHISFVVPRGYCVMAGGLVEPDAREFRLVAEFGAETYGVLSNPFLRETANTTLYEVTVTIHDDGSFSYEEDTVLDFTPLGETFHHTDRNTLKRVD